MKVIRKHAIKNALDFGKADKKAVLGKVLAESPELREKVSEILPLVEKIVEEVNAASKEQLEEEVKEFKFIEKKENMKKNPIKKM